MTNQIENHTHELTSTDLEQAVGGGERVNLQDFSIVKTLDKSSASSSGLSGGKVSMQDIHFVAK